VVSLPWVVRYRQTLFGSTSSGLLLGTVCYHDGNRIERIQKQPALLLHFLWGSVVVGPSNQYVAASLATRYSPLLIPPYFLPVSSQVPRKASIHLSKSGLQK